MGIWNTMSTLLLGKPNTKKKSFQALTNDFFVGSSTMQGWRTTAEDAHTIVISSSEPTAAYFAVFDGHGGYTVSEYVSQHLHNYIFNEESFPENIREAIEEAFLKLDTFVDGHVHRSNSTGSTANIVLIRGNQLYCGNAGDSRAVAFAHGDVIPLSTDHTATLSQEKNRILEAGAFISEGRINGDLIPSRAFGDFDFKRNPNKSLREQAVTSMPAVSEMTIDQNWEFIVLACDGIWEVMSNEAVCRFVKSQIVLHVSPSKICEMLMMECLSQVDSQYETSGRDNMTVIIVVFMNSFPQLYENENNNGHKVIQLNYICNHSAVKTNK